jgi:aminoglycoside phosphotransferase family enzyme/predicted kinase
MHQNDIMAFLSTPQAYALEDGETIERFDTHISVVFLAGDYAYKLKRAIALPFVDFSNLQDRIENCQKELEINSRFSPWLYESLVNITKEANGFALDGTGEVCDVLVKMKRFDQADLFESLCDQDILSTSDMIHLCDHIVDCYHASAIRQDWGGYDAMKRAFDGHYKAFEHCPDHIFDPKELSQLKEKVDLRLALNKEQLTDRQKNGYVRECHGDLHLRNICFFEDQVTLFDAIEFEPDFAVIDVLYDLSFLLMDLCHRGRIDLANRVMNRYMGLTGDVAGLHVLGLFQSSRAAIRTHVNAVASQNQPTDKLVQQMEEDSRTYLKEALSFLEEGKPALIAIGGLSGSGKSVLAQNIAPELGLLPGALITRTDMIRKRLMKVKPHEKLSPYAYRDAVNKHVYNTLYVEAHFALHAGYHVIVDGVFARQEERQKVKALADEMGVPFFGIWLEGEMETLEERVLSRRNDPSDATVEVLRKQAEYDLGAMDWDSFDAGLSPQALKEKVLDYLT